MPKMIELKGGPPEKNGAVVEVPEGCTEYQAASMSAFPNSFYVWRDSGEVGDFGFAIFAYVGDQLHDIIL
jgi:hypothetical protein